MNHLDISKTAWSQHYPVLNKWSLVQKLDFLIESVSNEEIKVESIRENA